MLENNNVVVIMTRKWEEGSDSVPAVCLCVQEVWVWL